MTGFKLDIHTKAGLLTAALSVVLFCYILFQPFDTAKVCAKDHADSIDTLKNGSMEISDGDISAQISFGFKGYVKKGKYMRIGAVISSGREYEGKFRVSMQRRDARGESIIEKKFKVEADDNTRVQFAMPVEYETIVLGVALCDSYGNVLTSGTARVDVDTNESDMFVGVLSDTPEKLGYISDAMSTSESSDFAENGVIGKIFDLTSTDFEKIEFLDSVNMIVLDNYATSKFSVANLKVLKKWLNSGGTLVVGTGSNYAKEFERLHGTFIKGYVGKTRKISTNFGWYSEKNISISDDLTVVDNVEIDAVRLILDDANVILKDGKENLLSDIKVGNGNIIVAEFALSLPKEVWQYYGAALVSVFESHVSEVTRKELMDNSSGSNMSNTNIYEALRINESDILPNLKLYGVILGIYIVAIGPVAYMIMRVRDKRNKLWLIVPAMAGLFSIAIYIMGSSTRIKNAYINYVSQVSLNDSSNRAKVKTLFTVTNSSNKPYKISLPGHNQIAPTASNVDESDGIYSNINTDKYSYGVSFTDNSTELVMNNLSAFESVGFEMQQNLAHQGDVNVNLQQSNMYLSGMIRNDYGYDLENCVIYYDGNMIYLGDMEDGKTVDIAEVDDNQVFMSRDYGYSFESVLMNAMGGYIHNISTDSNLRREIAVVNQYHLDNINQNMWFYGFVKDDKDKVFTGKFDCDIYGVTGVYKNIEINEKIDGYDVIDSLENYAVAYNTDYTNGYDVYSGAEQQFQVTYRFPENFLLKEIIYSEQTAEGKEFYLKRDGSADSAFVGSVSVRNKKTRMLVKIMDFATETKIRNMDRYLNDDGSLTLYYTMNFNSHYDVSTYCLPRVKLAGYYTEGSK